MSAHVHTFDPISGWCRGCTVRDDGRQAWHGDIVRPGPTYTPDQTQAMLQNARTP